MTLDDQIEILQAAKRGEEIQCRPKYPTGKADWYEGLPGGFNFATYEYRVKPKDIKVQLFLCSPKHKYDHASVSTYRTNCEATFNKEGELIKVELI
jgi:hypothetical protein